jgi:uncharacterized protein (DUF58 family)
VVTLPSIEPQTLAKIRGLKLRARRVVEGYVAGLHRSPYRGFSTEFSEHREYTPGDDLRYVDWKVFGRTDKFYLKQFEDERNLLCYVALDVSESMIYAGRGAALSKLEYAQVLAAALAWLVLHQQDAVGVATFDSQIRTFVRAASNPSHVDTVVGAIEACRVGAKTSLAPIFRELSQRLTRRGVVVVISDFFDDLPTLTAGLGELAQRQHDVVLLHVLDPAEIEFPFAEPTEFLGLESLSTAAADPDAVRSEYLRAMSEFCQKLERASHSRGIDYFLVRTDEPLDLALAKVLARREGGVR